MSEVICNTSPLQYLHQLRLLDLLPTLYGRITAPAAVEAEILVGRSRGVDLPDLAGLAWLTIRPPEPHELLPSAEGLGAGETEVLILGRQMPGALVILDDGRARQVAQQLGLALTGTLGILVAAKAAGSVTAVRPLLDELHRLGFRMKAATQETVLRVAGE